MLTAAPRSFSEGILWKTIFWLKNLYTSALVSLSCTAIFKTQHETVLSKQILRSGTSIGANINEAQYGNSKADFISKLHIALKETAETEYWLHILLKSDYLDEKMADSLLSDCIEIKKILIASINTAKSEDGNSHQ